MKLRKLGTYVKLEGTRVLIRIDANVPIKNGKVVDGPHGRIARAAVDLDWLSQHGAKIIVLTHVGRPHGRRVSSCSVRPVARRLSELLATTVKQTRAVTGVEAFRAIAKMKNGEILLLENMRFDPREEQNDPHFARELAELGDVYVNDAFSVSHRAHASVSAIAKELPAFAGPLLANEFALLSRLERRIRRPFVLFMGGVKSETKIPVIERFLRKTDKIVIGGALASTFLAAQGLSVGKSVYDPEGVSAAKALWRQAREQLELPTDVFVARSFRKDAAVKIVKYNAIGPNDRIVDIGPETKNRYLALVKSARTIVWNGPFGYAELPRFSQGTAELGKAIAERTGSAFTIVGGGDTTTLLEQLKLVDKFSLLSTGGGALLDFLAGKKLPGLEALKRE